MYQEQLGFSLHPLAVVVLNWKLLHPRSLPPSTLISQLFLDTENQVFPEPVTAGFFSSSSRIRLPLQSNYFALEWQFARVAQESDSRRLVSYST